MNISQKILIRRRRQRRENNGGQSLLAVRLLIGTVTLAVLSAVLVVMSGVGAVAGVYAYYTKDLPDPEAIEYEQEEFETTKIYDRTGQHLLYEVFDPRRGDRTIVPLDQTPPHVRQATIAIEDASFYENPGVNLKGFARAAWSNLSLEIEGKLGFRLPYSSTPGGGSSITMQLVKNVLIPPEERTQKLYSRKIKEAILALEISRRFPGKEGKDKILEWYLNYNYYGNFAYGIEAASNVYFDKHVQDLTLAEAAMLAALPQFPALNPIDAPEEARERQHLVLDAMLRNGYITAEECVEAKYAELKVRSSIGDRFDIKAPHFSVYVTKLLEEEFGTEMVYRGGLKVYTTLDLEMQTLAEEITRQRIKELQEEGEDRNVSNAALVSINPKTGEILAMVGSIDYWNKEIDGNVNVALAERQPGSSFKPFTYVTAFSQGYTLATMIMDVRTCPNPMDPSWCPENYPDREGVRKYHGAQRIRLALARSYNIPAVKVLDMAGIGNVIKTAHRMGINTLDRDLDYYGLSLTLGGGEVRLIDMTYAFGVFANGGVMAGQPVPIEKQRPGYRELDPVAILMVQDANGNVLKQYTAPQVKEVLSPQLAYLMNNVLSDNNARIAAFGQNNKLYIEGRPVAAKTGTTENWRDAWTIGYTPQLITGVWVGNSNNEPMNRVPGSLGAAPIWHDFMEKVLEPLPVENFVRPPGIVEEMVCPVSGMLPTEHCPPPVKEVFIEGTEPTGYCEVHQAFRINKETGKLATVYTPPELVEERVYEIYPPEAADWVREANIPQPPTEYDSVYGPDLMAGDVSIIQPPPYAYISEGTVIVGNAKSPDFQLWRLEYGEGLNPSAWIQIGGDHYDQQDNTPLDYWDVSELDGLYTLQLRVIENSQNYKDATIQVTVDNILPTVELVYPPDGKVYVMEDDEYVNIKADAKDNVSMDRVEFYLDNRHIETSTVAPYSKKWVIVMSDTVPIEGFAITSTVPITNPDGTIGEQVITFTQVTTNTFSLVSPGGVIIEGLNYTQVFSGGMNIISNTLGYTETHQIHVVAYDAAGNSVESGKVQIFVVHKEEEEKKEGEAEPTAMMVGREVAYLRKERKWRTFWLPTTMVLMRQGC
jgi:membrane carboxypeptidase/penicillin-binding protein